MSNSSGQTSHNLSMAGYKWGAWGLNVKGFRKTDTLGSLKGQWNVTQSNWRPWVDFGHGPHWVKVGSLTTRKGTIKHVTLEQLCSLLALMHNIPYARLHQDWEKQTSFKNRHCLHDKWTTYGLYTANFSVLHMNAETDYADMSHMFKTYYGYPYKPKDACLIRAPCMHNIIDIIVLSIILNHDWQWPLRISQNRQCLNSL